VDHVPRNSQSCRQRASPLVEDANEVKPSIGHRDHGSAAQSCERDRQVAGRVLYLPSSNSSPQQANKLTATAAPRIQAQPCWPNGRSPSP
jgi:hypothetical protein